MDLESSEGVAMLAYMGKNIIKGTRANDEYMLDWEDVAFVEADTTDR